MEIQIKANISHLIIAYALITDFADSLSRATIDIQVIITMNNRTRRVDELYSIEIITEHKQG